MTHPETATRTFLTLRITPFIRATVVVAAVLCIVGSCRVINGEVQEHQAWRRYETLEREIGIRRGMDRAALVAALEARGVECGVQGDPERPADKYPPQVLWAVVAKWEGPVFGEELGLEADIDATGRIVSWRPVRQGGT